MQLYRFGINRKLNITIMLNNYFQDSIANTSVAIIGASLPLITIGMISHLALLIAAGSVGGVFLFVFIFRMIYVLRHGAKRNYLIENILHDLGLPYCFALSFAIGIAYGEKAGWFGIWFALALAVMAVISNVLTQKSGK